MGLFLCPLCNDHFTIDPPHKCNDSKITSYIKKLKTEAHEAEMNLHLMQDDILFLIKEIPSLEKEKVEVSTKWIKSLWQYAGGNFYRTEDPVSFLSHWMAMHRILCEAFDLFRSKNYKEPKNLLSNLKQLLEVCEHAKTVLGYEDSKFDLSPEDIVNKLPDGVTGNTSASEVE